MKTANLFLAAGLALSAAQLCAAEGQDVTIWASTPLTKVFQNTPVPEDANTEFVAIEALRNEYEPAMFCITSTGYQGTVSVEVSPLVHAESGYAVEDINTRFVGYVKTPPKSADNSKFPFADSPLAYPDPLLPVQSMDLTAGSTQPVWLTVKVPADAPAGEYRGTATVKTASSADTIGVVLTVYPVTLPEEPLFMLGSWGGDCKLTEFFGIEPYCQWMQGNSGKGYLDFFTNVSIKNRREHRARLFTDQPFWEFDIVKVYWEDGKYVYDYSELDKLLSCVEAAYAPGWFVVTCVGVVDKTVAFNGGELDEAKGVLTSSIQILNPDGSLNNEKSISDIRTDDPRYLEYITAYFQAMKEHLESRGWLDNVYFKVLDEPTQKIVDPVLELAGHIKSTVPGIQLDLTYWEPASGVRITEDYSNDMLIANYWLVDASEETRAAVQTAAEEGRTVLLYNDPKVTINEPLVLTRKIGWRCYDINAHGYMHWAYAWKTDPWDNPGDATWGYGAHYLVYPDRDNKTVIDSIRWEMLRETAEDYDTLALLEAAGGISWKYAGLVSDYTGAETPEEFYEIRRQVLQDLAECAGTGQ